LSFKEQNQLFVSPKFAKFLGNRKVQVETLQKSGIYQIDFLGCSASYIGQSRRGIKRRFNVHHRIIHKNHPELSSIANHVISQMNDPRSKLDINLDNFSLLKEVAKDKSSKWCPNSTWTSKLVNVLNIQIQFFC
jgi:hypothetical protein